MAAERELSSLHPESHRDPLSCAFTPEQQSIDHGMPGNQPNHRERGKGKKKQRKVESGGCTPPRIYVEGRSLTLRIPSRMIDCFLWGGK